MADYTQAGRPMSVATPLGKDVMLLVGLQGAEAVSQLFQFHLDVLVDNKKDKDVKFDKLLGAKVSAALQFPGGKSQRYFSGLCRRVVQGQRDPFFTAYQLEIVPPLWALTRKAQSRIFQHVSVPDVLKKVVDGIDAAFELQGTFDERDYLVQYRETDFAFFSRLCEEEGLFYFFRHTEGGCQLVVANTPQSHKDVPDASKLIFEQAEGGNRPEDRVHAWRKTQELRSGKVTLWDHCFELPHKHLEADKTVPDSVAVGAETHKLKVGGNDKLELYDWPGGYAQRFDGVDKGGGDRAADVQKIFSDNKRTTDIRLQQETAAGLAVEGASTCRQLTAGFKFALDRHFNANGPYVLLLVEHTAVFKGGYRSDDEGGGFSYGNRFRCLPAALPYRPPRDTPRPVVHGTQTAVVVGPAGEEIFTDKYGRVKVQFHWDRQGKGDADSSCWVRVGTPWAGTQWGMIHIPRIGQEVIVAFEEGDPDRPIVVGSVYNAAMMPPYKLPDNKTQSGLKTRSTLKGGEKNFNELRFEDKKGSEDVYFHAEKDFHRVVENDDDLKVGHDQTIEVKNDRTEKVKEGNEKVTIEKGDRTIEVTTGNDTHNIKKGNREVTIDMGNDTLTIKMGNQTTKLNLGASSTEAMQSIELKVGQSSVKLDQMGVTIKGMMVSIEGQVQTSVKGVITQVQGSGMLQLSGGIIMIG
jgi:type VI secretion system secreted protein VgrG